MGDSDEPERADKRVSGGSAQPPRNPAEPVDTYSEKARTPNCCFYLLERVVYSGRAKMREEKP